MGTVCDSDKCGDQIYWLENDHTRRRAPIHGQPLADGNITIDLGKGTYHVLSKKDMVPTIFEEAPSVRYWPHFALCADVIQYIRRCGSCRQTQTKCVRSTACQEWRDEMQAENDVRRRKYGLTT